MNALDYILDGLEAELVLERELGVRTVEFDRSLLEERHLASVRGVSVSPPPTARTLPQTDNRTDRQSNNSRTPFDFVFLHHAALSPKGVEMVAKIIAMMGRTAETAPVVIAPPLPKAKIYIVLGGLALKRFFPQIRGGPGHWETLPTGEGVQVTYSPEYVLRFGTVTPAVKKMKQDMWTSLKAVVQRTR